MQITGNREQAGAVIPGILFYVFAAVLIGASIGVITSRNPVHSALYLVLAFVQSSALWLLLEAEFLAVVLVLVYVGAVMVLFLFIVMMLVLLLFAAEVFHFGHATLHEVFD